MFQMMLIYSPGIVLFMASLVCLVLSVRSYRLRKEKLTNELGERTVAFLGLGNMGSAVFGGILLSAFTRSHTVFLVLLVCGIVLFLGGELTLRTSIIAGKEYFFSSSITMFGAVLAWFNFPLLINIHEPFTAIYAGFTTLLLTLQLILVISWKKRRMSKKS